MRRMVSMLLLVALLILLPIFSVQAKTPPQGSWVLWRTITMHLEQGMNGVDWYNFNPPSSNGHYYMFTSSNMTYNGNRGTLTLGLYGNRNFSQNRSYPYANFFRTDPNHLTGGPRMYVSPMGQIQLLLQSPSNASTVDFVVRIYYWVPAGQ